MFVFVPNNRKVGVLCIRSDRVQSFGHSKNADILYKLLGLFEDREQIITDRNTKTNFQITNSADQPL